MDAETFPFAFILFTSHILIFLWKLWMQLAVLCDYSHYTNMTVFSCGTVRWVWSDVCVKCAHLFWIFVIDKFQRGFARAKSGGLWAIQRDSRLRAIRANIYKQHAVLSSPRGNKKIDNHWMERASFAPLNKPQSTHIKCLCEKSDLSKTPPGFSIANWFERETWVRLTHRHNSVITTYFWWIHSLRTHSMELFLWIFAYVISLVSLVAHIWLPISV